MAQNLEFKGEKIAIVSLFMNVFLNIIGLGISRLNKFATPNSGLLLFFLKTGNI